MKCPTCERQVPADAQFCIYCAAQIQPTAAHQQVATVTPATGPTTRLSPEPTPSYTLPGQPAAPSGSYPIKMRPARRFRGVQHVNTTPFFLIGLAVLMFTGNFWPGILVLIGAMAFINETARGRRSEALQGLIFFGGLALLFWTGWWWPGIFLVIAASSLMKSGWRCGW